MFPKPIQQLIDQLTCLPSVGPKTAERYVFFLLRQNPEFLYELTKSIAELPRSIVECQQCHNLGLANPCVICADSRRDARLLCLVAQPQDIAYLENTKQYLGLYYVIGGPLSPTAGLGPEVLALSGLLARLQTKPVEEIILAFSPDLPGETTALYLTKVLSRFNSKISRLARGLPSGASLEYADEMTLGQALKYRTHST